jgi:hypothetical protein
MSVNQVERVRGEISEGAELSRPTIIGLRTRTFAQAFAVAAVLALWAAPSTPAQTAQGDGQSSAPAQNSSAAMAATPASAEPQLQDQSAAPGDSLAEAARKAKAAKAKASVTTAAPAKVYNNESMSSLSSHGVSFVGSTSSDSGSTGAAANNGSVGGGNGANSAPPAQGQSQEAYWRGRAQAIRNQMAQIDQQIARVQDDIAKNGAVSVDPSSGARQGVIIVEDRNAEIKRLEGQKADLQQNLEALAEEGRKAGADSGWFR